jgi:hypothetical protein
MAVTSATRAASPASFPGATTNSGLLPQPASHAVPDLPPYSTPARATSTDV